MTFVPTLTRKMAKGTGGPAGDECQNLIVPALASTLQGHNGKGGSGISPEDTFVSVGDVRVVSPEDDRNERLRLGELELPRLRESNLGVTDSLFFATVETDAIDEVGHASDYALPAQEVKAAVRRLTPIECERLQGLPDNWTLIPDTAPDSRRYAGLGDAVTANVAEWIGRRLLTVEAPYTKAAA